MQHALPIMDVLLDSAARPAHMHGARLATSAAGAPSPSICRMGSPGTRWISKNTTDTTSQTTGTV